MACEMRLAVLAAENLVGVEVGVVDEAHARRLVVCWPESARVLDWAGVEDLKLFVRLGSRF